MSRMVRRTLSWVFVLAILVAALIGWNRVPGAGGALGELRWLLGKQPRTTQDYNRASTLLLLANNERMGCRLEIYRALVFDSDERVVDGVLVLLHDELGQAVAYCPRDGYGERFNPKWNDALRITTEWFDEASEETHFNHADRAIRLFVLAYRCARHWHRDFGGDSRYLVWQVLATLPYPGDYDLFVATQSQLTSATENHPFNNLHGPRRQWPPDAFSIRVRLRILDGRTIAGEEAHLPPKPRLHRVEIKDWWPIEIPGHAELLTLIEHEHPAIRWAAGRIMAICYDKRGLPGVKEWLDTKPSQAKSAEKVLSEMYGPDWRELCESGGAASQPGGGDVGGDG
ncbi:MAG: hypothetical protein ABIG44_11585 [Planctomycetota bacterium]